MTEAAVMQVQPETEAQRTVRTALRELEGRATLGDVVEATGFSTDQAQTTLKELLGSYQGHLAVGESGDLVYQFDPDLIRRDHVSAWARIREKAKAWLTKAFKVWIMLMLVVYFVVFVVLIVAAIVAVMAKGDDDSGFGGGHGRGRGGGHFHFPFWLWFWSPGYGRHRHYYGSRYLKDPKVKVPFYRKVFAFVFGPDRPELTPEQRDRSLIRLIRARRGVLTSAELVQHTGATLPAAEEEMGRLMGSYEGDVDVTDDGELVYAFPELMVSAHGPVSATEPPPAWRRLERPLELTGNEKKDDGLILGLNGFNLLAAAVAPGFIFPALGIGGPAAWIGLVLVPLVFSVIFFGIPLVRRSRVRKENALRERRNIRKLLESSVFEGALLDRSVDPADAYEAVKKGLGRDPGAQAVQAELEAMAAEFDADVTVDQNGVTRYRFPAIRKTFLAGARARDRLALDRRTVGEIVYSSADDDATAGRRSLADFDRELAGYVAAPGRTDYFDDLDVIAFEEELARGGAPRG